MLSRNRILTTLTTACYLLVVSGSALFHDHHDACDHCEDQSRPGVSASHSADDHDCLVCRFLAHKPAPAAEVTTQSSTSLVQKVLAPVLPRILSGVFSAWHSRAPPASA